MPRTAAEVQTEYDGLKAAGGRWWTTPRAVELRDEMKALAANDIVLVSPSGGTPPPAESHTLGADVSVEVPIGPDPFQSAEWNFIERAIAEFKIEFTGKNSNVAMFLYQALQYKVNIWRAMRKIVSDVGPSGDFPAWTTLGLNDSSGLPALPKPVPALPVPALPVPGGGVQGVTEGGMPIVNKAPPRDEMAEYAQVIANSIAKGLGSRTEPVRELPKAEPALA